MMKEETYGNGRKGARTVIMQIMVMVIVMVTAGFITKPIYKQITGSDDMVNVTIISSALYSFTLLVIFTKKKWCVLTAEYVRERPWMVLTWTALVAAGSIIPSSLVEEIMPKLPNFIEEEMTELINNDFGYFTICLFAPFIEEMIMRGAVLRTLLNTMRNKWGAIAISAIVFSLIHMNPAQMPFAFVAGLFLGWLYSRTGSILPGVVFHWVNNTIVFIFCRMMPQFANADLSQVFGGDHKRMGLAVIFSLFIMVPSIYQLAIKTKKA